MSLIRCVFLSSEKSVVTSSTEKGNVERRFGLLNVGANCIMCVRDSVFCLKSHSLLLFVFNLWYDFGV